MKKNSIIRVKEYTWEKEFPIILAEYEKINN